MSTDLHTTPSLLHQPPLSSDGAVQRSSEHSIGSENLMTRTLPVPTTGNSLSLQELDVWLRETRHRKTDRPLAESLIAPVESFISAASDAYSHGGHPVAIAVDALRFPAEQLEECRVAIELAFVDSLFIQAYPTVDVMQRVCDPFTRGVLHYAVAAANARSANFVVRADVDLDAIRFVEAALDQTAPAESVWESCEQQDGSYAYAGYQRLFFSNSTVLDPYSDLEASAFLPSSNPATGRLLSPLEWLCVMEIRAHMPGYLITGDAEWLRGVSVDGAMVGCQSFIRNTLYLLAPDDVIQCNAHRISVG